MGPSSTRLGGILACAPVTLPPVISHAKRPGPPLPTKMACGSVLPSSCFNPFEESAPQDTFKRTASQIAKSVATLIGLPPPPTKVLLTKVLLIDSRTLASGRRLDEELCQGGYWAFVVHSQRDVLLAGLTPELARQAFLKVAHEREASFVVDDASDVVPLIRAAAEEGSKSHATYDNYTARFGYSCGPAPPLPPRPGSETLARAIARGGTACLLFRNHQHGNSLGSSRAHERKALVDEAAKVSEYFRKTWIPKGRPRVTKAFRKNCKWVRAPFVLRDSLPLAANTDQVRLARWETTLRGVEEHLMLSYFGSLPNVTWARILAKVLERAEGADHMGAFDVDNYRQWAHAKWAHAHGVGPGKLGCPFLGCGSRILPKGACGIATNKPMHDDDNGVISLSCWTSMTEADTSTELVFLINGHEVVLCVSALRWVLFMGYIPHETRPADPTQPASTPRVHHSSFVKPEAEHLAAQVLSNLPCGEAGGDWSMRGVHRLRSEAFDDQNMRTLLHRSAESRRERAESLHAAPFPSPSPSQSPSRLHPNPHPHPHPHPLPHPQPDLGGGECSRGGGRAGGRAAGRAAGRMRATWSAEPTKRTGPARHMV